MKLSWSIEAKDGSSDSQENSALNPKEKRPNLNTEKEQKKTDHQSKTQLQVQNDSEESDKKSVLTKATNSNPDESPSD